jgi:16S rRNA (guanine1207-N2)-methyltransferase
MGIIWDMQNPAHALLLEYLYPKQEDRILVLEGGDGHLAREAAQLTPTGEVLSLARDVREVWATQTRLESLANAKATSEVIPTIRNWDIVLLTIPKERRYARTLLLAAWETLKPNGRLLLAGPSKGGAKAVIKDAESLFGNVSILGYRRHQRVAACTRKDSLPDPLPEEFQQTGITPGTRNLLEVSRPEGILKLETHPGIFSWEALDEGTALLLEHLKIEPESRVWDVGCGYGVIGLSAALAGAGQVTMSDVNLLAVRYTQSNAVLNKLDGNTKTFATDGLQNPGHSQANTDQFDIIISNPAFHQGRDVNKSMAGEMIRQAPKLLLPSGRLVIVANRFLNYDKTMRDHFATVTRIAETNKYHILEAQR